MTKYFLLLSLSIQFVYCSHVINVIDTGKIQTAIDTAQSGDVIFVNPSVYREKIVLKNGVNIHLESATIYFDSNSTGDAVLSDNGSKVITKIYGSGKILRNGTTNGYCLIVSNDSSIITIDDNIDLEGVGYDGVQENHKIGSYLITGKGLIIYRLDTKIDMLNDIAIRSNENIRYRNGIVSLIFWDGFGSDYATVFPELKSRNIPAGFGIPYLYLDQTGKLTTSQMKEMVSQGMEILGHGYNHDDDLLQNILTPENFKKGVLDIVPLFRDKEIQVQTYSVPGGSSPTLIQHPALWNEQIDPNYARLIMANYYSWEGVGSYNETTPISRWQTGHRSIATITDKNFFLVNQLQNIVKGHGAIRLGFHSNDWNTGNNLTTAEFRNLLDTLVAFRNMGLIDIVTPTGFVFAKRGELINLAYNPSFEDSFNGWTLGGTPVLVTCNAYDGNIYARVQYYNGFIVWRGWLKHHRTLKIKFWVKGENADSSVTFPKIEYTFYKQVLGGTYPSAMAGYTTIGRTYFTKNGSSTLTNSVPFGIWTQLETSIGLPPLVDFVSVQFITTSTSNIMGLDKIEIYPQ